MTNKHYIGATLIIISGFLVRMINIELPIFEVAMWRQCGTAYIARNFYEHGMNIFYPQMVGGGDIKAYVGESEFQIYTYTVAILYKLFGVHEYLGRLVSILAYCGGAAFLYKLAIKYIDKRSSLIALLFYTFCPYLFFYTRSFQPDSCMIFFSIAMLYYFFRQRYNNGSPKQTVGSFVRKARVANSVIRTNRHRPSFSIHSEK